MSPVGLPTNTGTHDFEYWQVTDDPSVSVSKENQHFPKEGYAFYPIEIKSRILYHRSRSSKTRCSHPLTYREEIVAVLNMLRKKFGDLRGKYYLYVNHTCGFHVHLGNGRNSFPLPTVKRIFSLFLACERQIDKLHARNRINSFATALPFVFPESLLVNAGNLEPTTAARDYLPISAYFMHKANDRRRQDRAAYGRDLPPTGEVRDSYIRYPDTSFDVSEVWNARRCNDINSWLTLVDHAPNLESLASLQAGRGRFCAVCIAGLSDESQAPRHNLNTVEFRQHVGTIHSSEALAYIDFLAQVVSLCHKQTDEKFYALLHKLKCRPETIAYYTIRLGLTKPPGFDIPPLGSEVTDPYSTLLDDHEKAAEARKATGHPFGELAMQIIRWQREVTNQEEVDKRILHKLKIGGYGQFTRHFLDSMLPPDVDVGRRIHLTIGYFGPLEWGVPDIDYSQDLRAASDHNSQSDSGETTSDSQDSPSWRAQRRPEGGSTPPYAPSPPNRMSPEGGDPLAAAASYIAKDSRTGIRDPRLSQTKDVARIGGGLGIVEDPLTSDDPPTKDVSQPKPSSRTRNGTPRRSPSAAWLGLGCGQYGPDPVDRAPVAQQQQQPRPSPGLTSRTRETSNSSNERSSSDQKPQRGRQQQQQQHRSSGAPRGRSDASETSSHRDQAAVKRGKRTEGRK